MKPCRKDAPHLQAIRLNAQNYESWTVLVLGVCLNYRYALAIFRISDRATQCFRAKRRYENVSTMQERDAMLPANRGVHGRSILSRNTRHGCGESPATADLAGMGRWGFWDFFSLYSNIDCPGSTMFLKSQIIR